MESTKVCLFCEKGGQLLFSAEQNCSVHSHCIIEKLTTGDQKALAIAKEFDMVSDSSECSVGCEECVNRWCGK